MSSVSELQLPWVLWEDSPLPPEGQWATPQRRQALPSRHGKTPQAGWTQYGLCETQQYDQNPLGMILTFILDFEVKLLLHVSYIYQTLCIDWSYRRPPMLDENTRMCSKWCFLLVKPQNRSDFSPSSSPSMQIGGRSVASFDIARSRTLSCTQIAHEPAPSAPKSQQALAPCRFVEVSSVCAYVALARSQLWSNIWFRGSCHEAEVVTFN